MIELLIVVIIAVIAGAYAVRYFWNVFNQRDTTCCGCEGCALKNQCHDKKTCEKFGQSKNK